MNPKFKEIGEIITEKHDYKYFHRITIKKLRAFQVTKNEDGRLSVLIVGIYIRTVVKPTNVCVQRRDVGKSLLKLNLSWKLQIS